MFCVRLIQLSRHARLSLHKHLLGLVRERWLSRFQRLEAYTWNSEEIGRTMEMDSQREMQISRRAAGSSVQSRSEAIWGSIILGAPRLICRGRRLVLIEWRLNHHESLLYVNTNMTMSCIYNIDAHMPMGWLASGCLKITAKIPSLFKKDHPIVRL